MIYTFRSTQLVPRKRGEEFGAAHADRIRMILCTYSEIYSELVGRKLDFARDLLDEGPVLLESALRCADQLYRARREVGRDRYRGNIKGGDCVLRYKSQGRVLAVASIYRDVESLKAELAMEQNAGR